MAQDKYTKITESGPQSFRDLQALNDLSTQNQVDPAIYSALMNMAPIISQHDIQYNSPISVKSPMLNEETGDYFGSSRLDLEYLTEEDLYRMRENPNQLRAEAQPWYEQLSAGVLKGTALAGTTFLDGVGLLYGIGSAIVNQDAGEIFNNKLSSSLREFNLYMEETLPVYRTQDEIENPMALRNLTSMATIADDFIKNIGFTVGAFHSGNAYLTALKSLVGTGRISSTAAKVIGSTLSGVNEGRIEAGNLYDEKVSKDISILLETYKPLVLAILNEPDTLLDTGDGTFVNLKQLRLQLLQDKYLKEEQAIKQRATNAGLIDLIGNSIYLPIPNYFTYGKLYARKTNLGRDLAGKIGGSIDDVAEQATKKEIFGNRLVKDAAGKIIDKPVSKLRSAGKGLEIFAIEGSEEMNLALMQSFSANYFTPDSPDAYYQALTNDDYEEKTKDFMTSFTLALSDSWGKGDAYKEFLIGGLNGILGMPTFGKVNNSDHNTWLGRGNIIGMSGGIFGEMANDAYYNQLAREAATKMNAFLDKINNEKIFLTRSQAFTDAMDGYSGLDNKFEFLNAKDNDIFNIIDIYGRTGRIQDIYDLVDLDFTNISDEELSEIASDTESDTSEWHNVDGSLMSDTKEGRQKMRDKLSKRKETIIKEIKSYEEALLRARAIGNNSLTDDLVAELAWLQWKQQRFIDRYNDIKKTHNSFINSLSKATLAFVRGRGQGLLTLSPELAAQEVYTYDAEGNIVSSRKKTNEEIEEEVKIGKGIKRSMEATSLFLNAISNTDSPLLLSYFVKENPEILKFIDDIGYPLIEGMAAITYDEYNDGMQALKDIAKIATAHKSFSDRYKEFVDNPIKVIQNRQNIDSKAQKANNVRNRSNVASQVQNLSAGDLAREADNGNIDFDSFAETLASTEGNNSNESPQVYLLELDKLDEALQLQEVHNSVMTDILNDDSLTPELIDDATTLFDAAYLNSNSLEEIYDLDNETYNEARNLQVDLDTPEDVVIGRLDEAKEIIRQKLDQHQLKKEAAKGMPSSSDTIIEPEDKGTINGREELDIIETEQERVLKLKKQQEELAKRTEEVDMQLSWWNNFMEQAYSNSLNALTPLVINELLHLKSIVDDSIINNDLPDKDIANILLNNPLVNSFPNNDLIRNILAYANTLRSYRKNKQSSLNKQIQQLNELEEDRGPVTPALETPLDTQAPKILDTLPEEFGKHLYLKPSAWKTAPSERYLQENYPQSIIKRMKAVRDYLESPKVDAFNNVDNNAVKVGDKIFFTIDPELVLDAGDIVILMEVKAIKEEEGKLKEVRLVVGDLPGKLYKEFKEYAGLSELVSKIELAYLKLIKDENNTSKKFTYQDFTPKVTQNLIGGPVYTSTDSTLNAIFGDKLKLALCLSTNGQPVMFYKGGQTRKSRGEEDNQVMLPLRASVGKPYVLLETSDPNRKYMPIPFNMPKFDGNNTTLLGKAIHSVVKDIIESLKKGTTSISLKNDLLDLIAVLDIYIEIEGDALTFRVKPQGATEFKTIVSATPLYTAGLEETLINSLIGSPYQVSRKYINEIYTLHDNGVPMKVPYNKMIGELAKTNLKEGITHTQGDWFITEPATGIPATMYSTGNNPHKINPTMEFEYNGMLYTLIKTGNTGIEGYQVKDLNNKTVEDANIRAYAFGLDKQYDMTKPYGVHWSVTINRNGVPETTSTFNPKTMQYIVPRSLSTDDLVTLMLQALALYNAQLLQTLLPSIPVTPVVITLQKSLVEQVEENFSGYFEGGGRILSDDYPGFNEELQSKFENYLFGAGEFTEDDAKAFLEEANKIAKSKESKVPEVNQALEELSLEDLANKAKEIGILNKNTFKAWDALSLKEQQLLVDSNLAESKMAMLTKAYSSRTKKFNIKMLLGASSVEEFILAAPKYLKTSEIQTEQLWDEKKELRWLARVLPQFTSLDRVRIVGALYTQDNEEACGQFWRNVITISKKAIRGTVYHEAFHGVINALLTEEEYKELFDSASKYYKSLNFDELEEKLAEDFRRYMKLQEIPVVGTFVKIFRTIKHYILKLLGNEVYINKVFFDIQNGRYATRDLNKSDVMRYSLEAVIRFQNMLDLGYVNNPRYYPINPNRKADSIKKLKEAWGKWKDNIERTFNVNIKSYRDSKTNKYVITSVTPKAPKYLRAKYALEMKQIEQEAIKNDDIVLKKDGSFDYAKAPNGKKSNLNKQQWLQVRTKAFKDWFGDWINNPKEASEVVDENGEPFVAYTGTNADFTVFDADKSKTASKGFFFTVDKNVAISYGSIVKEVFLNIRNLKEEATAFSLDTENGKYDGVSYIHKGAEALVVWDPNQIKSATDNEGDFSIYNDEITDEHTPEILQQKRREKFMFSALSEEDKQFILDRITLEDYNKMSTDEKEVFLHCK